MSTNQRSEIHLVNQSDASIHLGGTRITETGVRMPSSELLQVESVVRRQIISNTNNIVRGELRELVIQGLHINLNVQI